MHRRRYLTLAATAAFAGCGQSGGGETTTTAVESGTLAFATSAFEDGGTIPAKYTADGADVSPPLSIAEVDESAASLVLIVDDPDAPGGTFVHWLLWNVPADRSEIPEGIPQQEEVAQLDGALQGTNGFGELGYRGPKPPKSDGPHTYRFTMHALETTADVPAGAKRGALDSALAADTVATARITAEYDRN